jgi:hypothetical protein
VTVQRWSIVAVLALVAALIGLAYALAYVEDK